MGLSKSFNVALRVSSWLGFLRSLGAQEPSARSAFVFQAFRGRGGGELTESSVGSDTKSIIIAYHNAAHLSSPVFHRDRLQPGNTRNDLTRSASRHADT
jgi:hypothetical protein